jgi:hypothetical protein
MRPNVSKRSLKARFAAYLDAAFYVSGAQSLNPKKKLQSGVRHSFPRQVAGSNT